MLELMSLLDSRKIEQDLNIWLSALADPHQLLAPAFEPSQPQIVAAFEFLAKLLLVALLVYAIVTAFYGRGSISLKIKMLAHAFLGIVTFFVIAMVVHVPFALLGGKASFAGTCLAYIYGASVYTPFLAICQWIQVAGMSPALRPYGLNPATASQAGQAAMEDPETDKFTFLLGSILALGLTVWILIVNFRALGFVHDLSGWRFWLAVPLSILAAAPVGMVIKRVIATMFEEPRAA